MALTDQISLYAPFVIIEQSAGEQGIISQGDLATGTAILVWEGSQRTTQDAVVGFNKSKGVQLKVNDTSYYIVDEQYIFFEELEAIPPP